MKLKTLGAALLTLGLGLSSAPAQAANGFKAIAKEFVRAADGKVSRVAVLPFEPADGSSPAEGWNISEKILTQMVRRGRIQAVERSFLRKIMDEHYLGRIGILNPATLKKIGQILSADAIVTGSFVTLGSEAVVNARFIDIETGVILAAEERRVDRDWFDQGAASFPDSSLTQDPGFLGLSAASAADAPLIAASGSADLRDSISENGCTDAAERVDGMERRILDLKARFWAIQLRKGVDLSGLKQNPASTISDPFLKKQFYEKMNTWYSRERIPELTSFEVKRFVETDRVAYTLYRECGI
ncbi:MAG: FlgO family outer membrane protein [Elusimicrobiota bacterium]|jgi:TolB-like protein